MSGEKRTLTYTPSESRQGFSLVKSLSLTAWIIVTLVVTGLVDNFSRTESEIRAPQQSLVLVIRQRHFTAAWGDWINSLSPRVAVMVISDRELPYQWSEGIKLRHGHEVVTEGVLSDGVRWTFLPPAPPEK